MYNQCLITPTILDSFEFAAHAPASWKSRAEEGFLAKLRREKVDYPAWVEKGRKFEDIVYRICNAHYNNEPITEGSAHFKSVCEACAGGTFQQKLTKKLKIDDQTVFLFGYSDVTFPSLTIDLKTTLNYKGEQKYLKGHQHLIYSFIRRVRRFKYIVAQWEDEESDKIQAVHVIDYVSPAMPTLENLIIDKIRIFFDYLRKNNLWLDYYQTFSRN